MIYSKIAKCIIVTIALFLFLTNLPASAITGGYPDGDAHPYIGLLVFDDENGPAWRCSGSLIAPNVVLTAGHCTDGALAARVWFDESVEGNPEYPFGGITSVEASEIHTNPDFCIGCGNGLPGFAIRDVGVIILEETVLMDEYAILPTAGLMDTLKNKTNLDIVGYGVQEQHYGGGTGGTCFGDSGGPDLLGGTDTVLAVNSYVTNYNCAGVAYSSRIDIAGVLEWINGFLPVPAPPLRSCSTISTTWADIKNHQ